MAWGAGILTIGITERCQPCSRGGSVVSYDELVVGVGSGKLGDDD